MMSEIKHDLSAFKRIVIHHKIECLIIAISTLVGLFCIDYIDGKSLTAWSVEIWDALFIKGINNIRDVFAENARLAPHGNGFSGTNLIIELPLAVWNLPLWLTHTFGNNTYVLSSLCMAWSKLFLVSCALSAGLQCYHLVYGMNKREDRAEFAAVVFWGSGTLMLSVGFAAQNEIVYILTFLLALRCICAGRKAAGLVWMIVTVTFAPFMILAELVALLFMSKNIFKILAMAITTYAPYIIIDKLIPPSVPSSDDYIDWFFNRTTFVTGIGAFSIFAVVILAVYAISYLRKDDDVIRRNRAMMFYLAVLTGAMCILSWTHVYRFFLCVPFLIVSVLGTDERDDRRVKASLLVFTGFELVRTMGAIFSAPYMVMPFGTAPWVQKITGDSTPESLIERLEVILPGADRLPIFINSITIGALLLMLYLIRMRTADRMIPINLPTRLFSTINALVPIIFFVVFFSLICGINVCYVPVDGNGYLVAAMNDHITIDQFYYSQERQSVKEVQVRTVTWDRVYPEDNLLCMDVIDQETGAVVGSSKIPASKAPNNDMCEFDMSGVKLDKEHWYVFRIYATGTLESDEQTIALIRSADGSADKMRHYSVINNELDDSQTVCDFDVVSKIISIG